MNPKGNSWFLVLLMVGCWKADGISQGAGQPGEFLTNGIGDRALGLGGAYTALAQGAEAVYWNPGGLARQYFRGWNISSAVTQPSEDTDFFYFAVAVPFQHIPGWDNPDAQGEHLKWTLAAGLLSLGSAGFIQRDELGNRIAGGTFSDDQSAIFVSLSREPFALRGHYLGVGVTAKFINHSLLDESGGGVGFDVGLQVQDRADRYRVGLVLQNLTEPDIGFAGAEDKIPSTVRLGVALNGSLFNQKSDRLRDLWLAFDTQLKSPGNRQTPFFVGAEYGLTVLKNTKWQPKLKLRIGYSGMESRKSFNLGASLNFRIAGTYQRVGIDYAVDLNGAARDVGNSDLRGSFVYNWTALTCKKWYEKGKGLARFPLRPENMAALNLGRVEEMFSNAEVLALEFGDEDNCQKASQLRLADLNFIRFFYEKEILQKDGMNLLRNAEMHYATAEGIEVDPAEEIDVELNAISRLYRLQCLIFLGNYSASLDTSKSRSANELNSNIKYLQAYSFYKSGDLKAAKKILSSITNYPLAEYLLGLVYYQEKDYQNALSYFKRVFAGKNDLPQHIFVPYFRDNSMWDDSCFEIGRCYKEDHKYRQALDAWLTGLIHAPYSDSVNKMSKQISRLDVSQLQ